MKYLFDHSGLARTLIRAGFGFVFGTILLWLAIRHVDHKALIGAAFRVTPAWIGVAILLYGLDIALRIQRWRILLRPVALLRYGQVAEALIVGYAANNLLPARLGELFRADLLKRLYGVSRTAALGSILVERICDGIIVMLLLNLGLLFAVGPSNNVLIRAGWSASGFLAVILCVTVAAATQRERISLLSWIWLRQHMLEISDTIATARQAMPSIILLSFLIWFFETTVYAAVLIGVGVVFPVAGLFLTVGIASLSTLLPSAPGYAGSYQLAFVLALATFGQDATLGVLSATSIQVFIFGALTIVGIILFVRRLYGAPPVA